MYICYFLRIHSLCKPVVFKWVSWTSNISITWELVQSVNSGSTLNTLSSVFWPFQTLYFPCTLPCIFFLSFSSSPFLLWSMGSQRRIHHPSGSAWERTCQMLLERCFGSNNTNGSIDLPSSDKRERPWFISLHWWDTLGSWTHTE